MKWDFKSGYLQPEDIQIIMNLASSLPIDKKVTIMDLGAGSGTSALAAAYGRGNHPYQIISVDIQMGAIEATKANMIQYGFITNWKGHIGRSDDAADYLEIYDVDMLMCDATHDYASKYDELTSWFAFLNNGAKIWVHEYSGYANQIYPGVKIAVDELIERGRLRTITVGGYSWAGEFIK